ncbi:methyltransferase domain-containing protein [Streptomyces sp. NBC_00053]|uniref:class I SAM-dependent methyltransferase n=1 Tax=unclassified Streptomyces TaxID=2593676 RepID=UPI0022564125|nr:MULTISPECIES: class I SAM-dependent methyltransferase [unclassified Streptomyces]MCX4393994.1 methyltransferase domain-containing protein [Streptomyces sp. NBC_01767]MCX5105945.1 methyltransferase domain-containing protein [Streptomyces sp. NBC_00439]MCX5162913.1 methyltransferase domain-containing protein [Streptomyces sp. NBC_00305]MCX5221430.1 methyltransferase domain-containing protein [Streptomyces sp. NBC_00264]MCX5503130.1 methyltransferase domain-containing protein [Streptomyces sp.
MTDLSAAHDAAVTDRVRLAVSAYNGDRDLAARQSLYQWQTPRYDLPGLIGARLGDVRGRVVDIGCGNGKFIQRLRLDRPDLSLLGLDIAPGILTGVPGPVAVADATRLPLASGSVDTALALHMLYHVPDIPQAVRELARVVASDGLVVASTNGDRDKAELDDLWQRAAGDVLGIDRGPARISLSARFSLEKAPAFLGEEFGRVEVVELPGTITVRDPEPVIAHMASYRAWSDQHDVPFDATIDRARVLVADHIVRYGAYEITCLGGILVCRR